MNVSLREAGPQDIDCILEIDRAHSPVFAQPASYAKLLGELGVLVVAAQEGALVGFAACSRVLDEATLLNLVVSPTARRQGVARLLLDGVIDCCLQSGVSRLLLEVRESNLVALALYRSAGFERDGERKDYYPATKGVAAETAVLMTRQLEIAHAGT
ncbi:ribosomal protein S18-alanine N-acetyltransferase [Congregibacter sp.]|uniref:ribosomal protein S18-alanine N-acetyltransferase n=1 Tax=Congregibacter sp. TaxID=2744308 RepID=UPI003F6C291E